MSILYNKKGDHMRGKVIKKVISMFLILVMMCALTGCGGSSITGTWYLTEVHSGEDIYNMDELAEIFDAAEDAEISVMLELKNGEFRLLEKESDDKNSELVVLLSGTYEENNGEYSFVIKGQEDVKENEV